MIKVIEDLVLVQDRDRRLTQLRTDLKDLPARKEQIRQRVKAREDEFHKAEELWKKESAAVKTLEVDIDSAKASISRFRQQQLEVKSNDQYRTLEHEIAGAQKKIRGLEDQEIEHMERVEAARAVMLARKKEWDEEQSHIEKDCTDLDRRAEAVGKEIGEIEAERTQRLASVDPQWLARYERVLKHKGDIAVVAVDNGTCGGCHMKLTPQVIQDTKRAQSITSCTFCGRMLYWKD